MKNNKINVTFMGHYNNVPDVRYIVDELLYSKVTPRHLLVLARYTPGQVDYVISLIVKAHKCEEAVYVYDKADKMYIRKPITLLDEIGKGFCAVMPLRQYRVTGAILEGPYRNIVNILQKEKSISPEKALLNSITVCKLSGDCNLYENMLCLYNYAEKRFGKCVTSLEVVTDDSQILLKLY